MKQKHPFNMGHKCRLEHNQSRVKIKPAILASSLAFALLAQPANAALMFNFNYISPGVGFDDPTEGAARKAALESAAGMLGAYFTNYTATLDFDVTSYSTNDTTLASAGSGSFVNTSSFVQTFVQSKIISNGTDANGATADGEINWNFFHNWGLDDMPVSPQLDFKSTAIHELLHAFGFASNIGQSPTNGPDTYVIFDQFLTDASGNPLVTGGVFDQSKLGALTAGGNTPGSDSPGVLFNGANAIAANGGNGIPIFSPSPFQPGSSISHLDDNSTVVSTSIMNAAAHNDGLDTRNLGPIEIGILKDIGYTQINASPVPVPAAVWLMGSGLMALVGIGRRRKVAV